jgi:hypothetical protein
MPWISVGLGHPLDAPAIYKGLGRAARDDDVATLSGGLEARQTCNVVYIQNKKTWAIEHRQKYQSIRFNNCGYHVACIPADS